MHKLGFLVWKQTIWQPWLGVDIAARNYTGMNYSWNYFRLNLIKKYVGPKFVKHDLAMAGAYMTKYYISHSLCRHVHMCPPIETSFLLIQYERSRYVVVFLQPYLCRSES
jgi:hypothetical protein